MLNKDQLDYNPKISLILPVYNVEEYIRQCLDSLVNQTLGEIEIICVDDCSTDASLSILKEYAARDKRFVVIEQKFNQGQGCARNKGLEIAQGEYILFIDPDDWISPLMCETMYNQAKKLNSEIVFCDFIKHKEDEKRSWVPKHTLKPKSLYEHEYVEVKAGENIDKSICDKILLSSPGSATNKIFMRKFIVDNNIKFGNYKSFEDTIFYLKSHIQAQNISYINSVFYNYRIRSTSTLRSYEERYKDFFACVDDVVQYLKEVGKYDKLIKNVNYFVFRNAFLTYNNINKREYKKELLKLVKKYLSWKNYITFRKKIFTLGIKSDFSITKDNDFIYILLFGKSIKIKRFNSKFPIDLVYLWVDGNDVEWKKEKDKWIKILSMPQTDATKDARFIDNQELRYSLRSVAKYAPWINHIYIVTNGQVPSWLDRNNPKVSIVEHKDIMPAEVLPTFNSEAIETCIHNIPGLSEHFIYANDDFFIRRSIKPQYFFDNKGNPIVRFVKHNWKSDEIEQRLYLRNITFSANLIKKLYKKMFKYEPTHNMDPYRKSYCKECESLFKEDFYRTCQYKFRQPDSIQRTIYSFFILAAKKHKLKILRIRSKKAKLENIYVSLGHVVDIDRNILKHGRKLKLFCINDNEKSSFENRSALKSYLEFLFKHKAEWELD